MAKPSRSAVEFENLKRIEGVIHLCALRLGFATAALPPPPTGLIMLSPPARQACA